MLNGSYDLLLVNGHGLLHPLKCGLVCYVGVTLGKPTIGVAESPVLDRAARRLCRGWQRNPWLRCRQKDLRQRRPHDKPGNCDSNCKRLEPSHYDLRTSTPKCKKEVKGSAPDFHWLLFDLLQLGFFDRYHVLYLAPLLLLIIHVVAH